MILSKVEALICNSRYSTPAKSKDILPMALSSEDRLKRKLTVL